MLERNHPPISPVLNLLVIHPDKPLEKSTQKHQLFALFTVLSVLFYSLLFETLIRPPQPVLAVLQSMHFKYAADWSWLSEYLASMKETSVTQSTASRPILTPTTSSLSCTLIVSVVVSKADVDGEGEERLTVG